MPVCKSCGGHEFERDHSNANSDLVCKSCGVVSEDNPIVSEVTFGETSSGAAVIQGSFIAAGQSHSSFNGPNALESREATINNARRKLRAVAHSLKIPDYVMESAAQWYKLALAYNFVQGRRSQNVIAACLYVACRKEKTHHMLIDFSSRLQVSVYSIGATFLKMVKRLHIQNLPLADPSLYIQHFAEKLNLQDKKIKVVHDAVKLAQRMSHEWMFEGRRPAGIAGACVLLACRMNNLRRTHSEIVAVSHVAEETLQQRLNEFKNTKAANLSIKEFRERADEDTQVDDGDTSLPPSFVKNLKIAKKLKHKSSDFDTVGEEEDQESIDRNPILSQLLGEQELSSKELLFYVKEFTKKRKESLHRIKSTQGTDNSDVHKSRNSEISETSNIEPQAQSQPGHDRIQQDCTSEQLRHFQDRIDGYSLETDPYRPQNLHLLPTSASLLSKVNDDPDNLDDVDDEELDSHLLDEEASKLKERIWLGINGDYLLEQRSKRLKQEADLLTGNTSAKKKRAPRKKKAKSEQEITPGNAGSVLAQLQERSGLQEALRVAEESGDQTTAESVKNMLQKASFSKKLNYEAIDVLFK